MNNFDFIFSQSIHSGFINKSIIADDEYKPQLIVNNTTSTARKKVLTTIQEELNNCKEFWFSVAFITKSGVASLINTLIDLESKGIKGKILVSQYLNFTQPEALKTLLKFKNIESRIAVSGDFHAKGYLFKKEDCYSLMIGSSNLTQNALSKNKEWNLKISATTDSYIIHNAISEFQYEFDEAILIDEKFIEQYNIIYSKTYDTLAKNHISILQTQLIQPNFMQKEALLSLMNLRNIGKTKALLISATGTGKTYLSAFDIKAVNPKRVLFVVHRLGIAEKALETYKNVFQNSKSMGLYSGNSISANADFIFSTVQTFSRDKHLKSFSPDHFDYIVIDETHRAAANSYQKIMNYFKPSFLLGMTATPERTDGLDIFELFDHNIAYEIRLHSAMEEDMLSPFHYYGVADVSVNDKILNEIDSFKLLTADERVNKIIEKAQLYGTDSGDTRGLIFCSSVEESKELSNKFNKRGYKTIALSGSDSGEEREKAIDLLESDDYSKKIDYIFSVDIFNEGIDIPSVNQIIMLRPTQSAIIFVQQLGRGLRKTINKEYLTVIDFIGNYANNFLIPIALYGDTSYNKDTLRRLISSKSDYIPGASTINFDPISRERIYQAIDSASMQLKKDLLQDYKLLKYKLGYVPMMINFVEHGSRDPQLYVNYAKSYYNFVSSQEDTLKFSMNELESKILEFYSSNINNSKRVEESIILKELILNKQLSIQNLKNIIFSEYGYDLSNDTIASCIDNLNLKFITERKNGKILSANALYGYDLVHVVANVILPDQALLTALENTLFVKFLLDNTNYSIHIFNKKFEKFEFFKGFILYQKYSRKDVFRILNWKENPLAQNVGGYIISQDKTNCPIFVNYHKEEHISSTTKYEDTFLNNTEFTWMSKSKRSLNSPDILTIKNHNVTSLRLPLFVKKSNDEGMEFYYMGDAIPIENSFLQTTMKNEKNENVSVVKINFKLSHRVDHSIYNYITNQNS